MHSVQMDAGKRRGSNEVCKCVPGFHESPSGLKYPRYSLLHHRGVEHQDKREQ